VVALGDSITDGFLSDFNANNRWPNDLARRLQALSGPTLSVTDEGIWGNEVLADTQCCGVSTLKRADRDVFEQPNVRDIIFLEGINDIGCSETAFALCTGSTPAITAAKVIAGYRQVIADAHQRHIPHFRSDPDRVLRTPRSTRLHTGHPPRSRSARWSTRGSASPAISTG